MRHAVLRLVAFSLVLLWAAVVLAQRPLDRRLDAIMYLDPELPQFQSRFYLSPQLKVPWLAALDRSETELQRLAADTITLAERYGLSGWDSVHTRLSEVLNTTSDRTVRRAAARALIALDARQAADSLAAQAAQPDADLMQLIEPALARWDYGPIRGEWLQRLEDPATERMRLLLAIEGLGATGESQALQPLLSRVQDNNEHPPIRLLAARAAARIERQSLVDPARGLAASSDWFPRQLAFTLVSHHEGDAALELLTSLATDSASTVAGAALRRLFELDPAHVYPLAPEAILRNDVNIRRVGAETLVVKADAESIALLGPLLNDANPKLRRYVSDSLIALGGQESLREAVTEACSQVLHGDDWRGLEQSAVVLGMLDHEPAGPRLVDLLKHRRPEVQSSTAWALRRLNVRDLFPPMLAHAQEQFAFAKAGSGMNLAGDYQISQILQLFGQNLYPEAEPLMRQLVPKGLLHGGEARPGAVWSLGYLYQNNAPEDLTQELIGRLKDVDSMLPEPEHYRTICAVTLGRMKAEAALPALREFANYGDLSGQACRWAIEQITGEKADQSDEVGIFGFFDWFLVPNSIDE